MFSILLSVAVAFQIDGNLPLKHDGYVVESSFAKATEDGRGTRSYVVKAGTRRALLYANY